MRRDRVESFATLDFEASSLSSASWPIEVGLSWLEGGSVRTWSSLIRPASEWDLGDWSVQSAAVHRIKFSDLETAPSAFTVAEMFMQVLGRRVPVSDAPEFDQRWLDRLLALHRDCTEVEIRDYDAVSFALFSDLALDMLYESLERRPAPHRAGPDSARLAGAWAKALEFQTGP